MKPVTSIARKPKQPGTSARVQPISAKSILLNGLKNTPIASSGYSTTYSQLAPPHPGFIMRSPSSPLTINQPGDPYEQEADRVAVQVMRRTAPVNLQRKCSACEQEEHLQRKCAACEEEDKQLQKKEAGVGPTVAPPIVHEVLSSPGQPLDSATRAFMEPRFGHDFSKVRVHVNARAAESARAMNALAYTVGQNIVFRDGYYMPQTGAGRKLIAHELSHVIQAQGSSSLLARQVDSDQKKKSGESHKELPPPAATSPSKTTLPADFTQSPVPDQPVAAPTGPDKATTNAGEAPSAKDEGKPKLALDQSLVRTETSDFQLQITYRDFQVASPLLFGRDLDVLHEPGIFIQWSFTPPMGISPLVMGALGDTTLGAAISIVNYHLFQLHGEDLLEVSLDAAGGVQSGDQGKAVVAQLGPTAQLHLPTLLPGLFGPNAETLLTVNFGGQATVPVGAAEGSGQPSPRILGETLGIGVKVQF